MATSSERTTVEREGRTFNYALANNAVINRGAMVMLVAGLATQGAAAVGAICVGVAQQSADETEGDLAVDAKLGFFSFKNSATDPVEIADVGSDCFIEDDETVAQTNGGNTLSRAGTVREIEGGTVWVEFG